MCQGPNAVSDARVLSGDKRVETQQKLSQDTKTVLFTPK